MPHVQAWSNWSGSLRFAPSRIVAPANEDEIARLVRQAAAEGQSVRAVGAGHSSSPLVETRGVLVSLEKLRGVEAYDRTTCEATVGPGTMLDETGKALLTHGMALTSSRSPSPTVDGRTGARSTRCTPTSSGRSTPRGTGSRRSSGASIPPASSSIRICASYWASASRRRYDGEVASVSAIGRRVWAIPGGRIPLHSTGLEPAFTSRDELFLPNAGESEACVELTIFYADRDTRDPTVSPSPRGGCGASASTI